MRFIRALLDGSSRHDGVQFGTSDDECLRNFRLTIVFRPFGFWMAARLWPTSTRVLALRFARDWGATRRTFACELWRDQFTVQWQWPRSAPADPQQPKTEGR